MGDADDIRNMFKDVTKKWTKQIKAEEKNPGARRYRAARLTNTRSMYFTEAMPQVAPEGYRLASTNNTLPATARQIMYPCRPKLQTMCERPLDGQYFCQTLLPDYMRDHPKETAGWDVIFDARGHFHRASYQAHGGAWYPRDALVSVHAS
jgi:hypothetical protein